MYLTAGECITDNNLKNKLRKKGFGPFFKDDNEYFLEECINKYSEYQPRKNKIALFDFNAVQSFGAISAIIPNLESERIRGSTDPIKFLNIDMREEIRRYSDNHADQSKLKHDITELIDSLIGEYSLFNVLIDFISISGNCLIGQSSAELKHFTPEKKEYLFHIIPILHKLILLKYLIIYAIIKQQIEVVDNLSSDARNQILDDVIKLNTHIDKLVQNVYCYNDNIIDDIISIKNIIPFIKVNLESYLQNSKI